MLKRFFHFVWLLSVAGLLLVAVTLSVARMWVPALAGYRHDVEQVASQALGRAVTIGHMHGTWRGLSPVVRLRDIGVAAEDPSQPPFKVSEIRLSVDGLHYLRHREVQFNGIDVIGADLVLVRDTSGKFYVEHFQGRGGGDGAGIAALPGMVHLSLHESSITFHDALGGKQPQRFSSVMLSITSSDDEHRLTGHAWLPGDVGYRLQLDALFTGANPDVRTWQGRAYIKGQQLSLSPILQYAQPQLAARGVADLRLWVDVDRAHIAAVHSELDMRDLHIERTAGDQVHSFSADTLGVQLGWRRTGDEWKGVLRLLSANRPDWEWEPFELSLAGGTDGDVEHLRISARQLLLDDLWQFMPLIPGLEPARLNELAGLKASGRLNGFHLELQRSEEAIGLRRFNVRFDDLGIAQSGAWPFVAGLAGSITGTDASGTLSLDSRDVDATDTRIFRDILSIDELHGDIYWSRSADNLRIESDHLAVANPDLALSANFVVTVPAEGNGTHLDLGIDVESANVGRVNHYLPAEIMSPTGVAWLDKSLVEGEVREGTVLVRGRLDQLPFDNGEGQLEVRLPVYNAKLDFNAGWTPITDLDAQVDFTGRSMDIISRRGLIRTAALQNVRAQINDLAKPYLTINGAVQGQLPVMLAELGSSPLGEKFGGFVDRTVTTGTCGLQLDIDIPLSGENRDVTVAGRVALKDNTLESLETGFVLSAIEGELVFDDAGIEGDGLRAVLFDRPFEARVWGEPGKPDTHIRLTGRLALPDALLDEGDPLRKVISGDSDWQIRFTMRGKPTRGAPANVGLRLSSTLAGTAIDLPAPLGKTAASRRPLQVTVDNVAGKKMQASLTWGDDLRGVLELGGTDNMQLKRGTVTLGGGKARLPDQLGLLINGRLASLHLSDWQSALGQGQSGPAIPLRLDLDVGELEVMDYLLDDLHLTATTAGRSWNIKVSGESTRGEIDLTRGVTGIKKVVVNMDRLTLTKSPDAKPARDSSIKPADMPELQIKTGELIYNGANFGQLDLLAYARADNLYRVERLALSSALLTLQLDGEWHMAGANHTSRVDMDITGGHVGGLLAALGYAKSIKDGALSGTLQASWPAPLWDVSTEIIDGKLAVKIKDGQLLDIEPGAGRALGLLNLARLPKRLTLDFTDLFGEGFNFDRIAGNFVLDHGNAYTNDLVVDGSSAKIEISGRVGLADRNYDELVTVTPYLDSSLPLAGAIAGGPVGAAAAIVAGKLLGDKIGLNKAARKQYTVKGSWDAPAVTRVNFEPDEKTDVADVYDEDME